LIESSDTCISCLELDNCLECTYNEYLLLPDFHECDKCEAGYVLDTGLCVPSCNNATLTGCASCSINNDYCDKCENGYALEDDFTCEACGIPNCLLCHEEANEGFYGCDLCNFGYELNTAANPDTCTLPAP